MTEQENTELNEEQLQLIEQLRSDDRATFKETFLDLHEYEQSELYIAMDDEEKARLYAVLSPEEVAEFYDSIDIDDVDHDYLFETMDSRYAAKMLESMQFDNAVDILNELSREKMTSLLALMQPESRAEISSLINYEADTAGGIMTTEYVSIESTMTVREAMRYLKDAAPDSETIYYVFVVDQEKLVGIISLRELIISDDDEYIGDVMIERVVSVNTGVDQEEVAQLMRDYDFLAIPVTDYQGHLLGIITHDDIIDVIDEEASEDYARLAGLTDDENTNENAFSTAKKRLPWLVGLTFMGMITATMLTTFEDTLQQVAVLGAFIPIIGGMAGNTGTQSLAVAVRGISSGEIKDASKTRIAMREMGSGFITGIVCGAILLVIITLMYQEVMLGVIVSVSLIIAMTFATLTGTLVPMFMNKIGIDPAIASGPFITTGNDIISLLVYFSLANMFIHTLL